jgi:hypothetical protein
LKILDAHFIDIKRLQGYVLLLANINLFDLTITLFDHLLNFINSQLEQVIVVLCQAWIVDGVNFKNQRLKELFGLFVGFIVKV